MGNTIHFYCGDDDVDLVTETAMSESPDPIAEEVMHQLPAITEACAKGKGVNVTLNFENTFHYHNLSSEKAPNEPIGFDADNIIDIKNFKIKK